MSIKANRFAAVSVEDVLQVLSRHAIKHKQEYKRAPVLIINNANKLAPKQQRLLDLFQDYVKKAADKEQLLLCLC